MASIDDEIAELEAKVAAAKQVRLPAASIIDAPAKQARIEREIAAGQTAPPSTMDKLGTVARGMPRIIGNTIRDAAGGATLGLTDAIGEAIDPGGRNAAQDDVYGVPKWLPSPSTAGHIAGTALSSAVGPLRYAGEGAQGLLGMLESRVPAALASRPILAGAGRVAGQAAAGAGIGGLAGGLEETFRDADINTLGPRAGRAALRGAKWGGLAGGGASALGEVAAPIGTALRNSVGGKARALIEKYGGRVGPTTSGDGGALDMELVGLPPNDYGIGQAGRNSAVDILEGTEAQHMTDTAIPHKLAREAIDASPAGQALEDVSPVLNRLRAMVSDGRLSPGEVATVEALIKQTEGAATMRPPAPGTVAAGPVGMPPPPPAAPPPPRAATPAPAGPPPGTPAGAAPPSAPSGPMGTSMPTASPRTPPTPAQIAELARMDAIRKVLLQQQLADAAGSRSSVEDPWTSPSADARPPGAVARSGAVTPHDNVVAEEDILTDPDGPRVGPPATRAPPLADTPVDSGARQMGLLERLLREATMGSAAEAQLTPVVPQPAPPAGPPSHTGFTPPPGFTGPPMSRTGFTPAPPAAPPSISPPPAPPPSPPPAPPPMVPHVTMEYLNDLRQKLFRLANAGATEQQSVPKDVLGDAADEAKAIVDRGPYGATNARYHAGANVYERQRALLDLPPKPRGRLAPEGVHEGEVAKLGSTLAREDATVQAGVRNSARHEHFVNENPRYERTVDLPDVLRAKRDLEFTLGRSAHGGLLGRMPITHSLPIATAGALLTHSPMAAGGGLAAQMAAHNWPAVTGRLLPGPVAAAERGLGGHMPRLDASIPTFEDIVAAAKAKIKEREDAARARRRR